MVKRTQRRQRRSKKMRGGMSSLMPASITDFNHGNYAASQASVSGGSSAPTNVSLAQSGGSRRKARGKRRRMRGGLVPLSPSDLLGGDVPTTGGNQKGGYWSSVLKAALVPIGLLGLNQYAHEHSGKTASRGKSRLSKRLQSRRHRR
jgi:hypothetical protein